MSKILAGLPTIALPLVISFVLTVALGPQMIRLLTNLRAQTFHWRKTDIDNSAFFELHKKKIGTPSMGGILMIIVTCLLTPFFVHSVLGPVFVVTFFLFGLLGLADDISKLLVRSGRTTRELSARPKFVAQWGLAILCGGLFYIALGQHTISLPGSHLLDLGPVYILLAALVLVSTTNAVNITDGLDGLAGGLMGIALVALIVTTLAQGRTEEAVLCALVLGPVIGFLFYNTYPARVIMGDVGALSLGAALGMLGLVSDNLVVLILVSGVFIVETLSSLAQTMALKRGRRIFKIAPLHHHFEALGWKETRITTVFWLIGLCCACLGILVGRLG